MSDLDSYTCQLLAEALRYPAPGLDARLASALPAVPDSGIRKSIASFVRAIQSISQGEWEELYTRTFDLSPAVAPYLGYHIWGDGYPRGKLMADLNRAYRDQGINDQGELPDHLSLVLRYLSTGAPPPPELAEVFSPATHKMLAILRKADKHNPYITLLEVACSAVVIQVPETGM